MKRHCVIKGTITNIDSSLHNTDEIFIQNALNNGFTESEIEIITEEEYLARVELEPKPIAEPTVEERLQALETMELERILGGM